ncbi:XerC/D-like integrase [Haloferax gibbonsii]|uniref:XerC/D-like integrase n=1 Tax=Haloferax gibbonsii TaxID=35746 RepID=A0A871BC31_HALGI|nr:site-specific integrase [Haloferax gibbonsii]QOS10415.1 XerC/D-like integrase [Haloferax gibbonsii]
MSQSIATPPESYRVRIEPVGDGSGARDGAPDLTPREARNRWLAKIRADRAESTVSSYHYRTKHFVEWCEEQQIDQINHLNGWNLDEFEASRRAQGLKTTSLNNELGTLKKLLEYCARIELVDDSLPEKVVPPKVPTEDDVDETRLAEEDALRLLEYYENDPEKRHSRAHVLLALAWFAGPPRLGAIRGLDIGDYHSEEQYVEYHHRPDEETPLKNDARGERAVSLPDRAVEVIDGYIEKNRFDVRDDYGREPLLTSQRGRPSRNAIRTWMYLGTIPCLHAECPHGNNPDSCEYIDYSKASQCPSSRSPHQVRTGAITWMRNNGVPVDVVSARANASVSVIEKHYDKPDYIEEMEKRRRPHLDKLDFEDGRGAGQ